jgi:fructokinase
VGAGDSFTAALIGALADHRLAGSGSRERLRDIGRPQLQEILEYAARAAAITVSRAGANPPTRQELGA